MFVGFVTNIRYVYYFVTNALFLRCIANFTQLICNKYHVIVPKKHCFCPKKALFCPQTNLNIADKIAYVRVFRHSPNFLAKALRGFAQLLPPWVVYTQYFYSSIDFQILNFDERKKLQKVPEMGGEGGERYFRQFGKENILFL